MELLSDGSNFSLKIHRNPIRQELKSKISDNDIELAIKLSEDSIRIYSLIKDIMIGSKCTKCQESENKMNQNIPCRCAPYGYYKAKAMFINAMPTELEHRIGSSHTDTTGIFLNLILNKLGYNKEDLYFTDFIKCHCQYSNEQTLWTCAFNYLFNEIMYIAPEIIVCEGLGTLKKLKESQLFKGFPETLEYGKIYDVENISLRKQIKIMSIYELNKVLLKTGEDYNNCKNKLWQQLSQVKTLINNQ